MTVIEDLKLAKATIEERGWFQGAFTDGHGVCTVGALNLVCCGQTYYLWTNTRRNEAYDALKAHLPEECGGHIPSFNDAPTTTKQDVLNLFEKALADLGGLA